MSFITFTADLKYVGHQLRRIADSLELLAGPMPEDVPELDPKEAVTYVDEERDALRELREEGDRLRKWMDDHPEEAEHLREGDEP